MKRFLIVTAEYIPCTATKPSRVRLETMDSFHTKQSKIFPYGSDSSYVNGTEDRAHEILVLNGIDPIGITHINNSLCGFVIELTDNNITLLHNLFKK